MKKPILIYNLLIVGVVMVIGILNAQESTQAIFSILFIPVAFYFLRQLMLSFRQPATSPSNVNLAPIKPRSITSTGKMADGEVLDPEVLSDKQVSDINRRLFLKLIGSAGLATFTFALFTKKSQAAFFGSIPGPGTVAIKDSDDNVIDPAEKQPTDGYEITDVEDDTLPAYYGFVDKDENWYIAREGTNGDYRYVSGSTDYATNWTNRASQSYNLFSDEF